MEFKINECRFVLNFWFVAVLVFCLLIDHSGITASGLFGIIIHESGHLWMLHYLGVRVKEINCGLFQIKIMQESSTKSYIQEICISFAGPIANIGCAVILFLIHPIWYYLPVAANLLLALFNLLPIASLDGGQVLFHLLCIYFPVEHADKTVRIISFLVLFPLAVYGFMILLRTRYNFALLFISCYLIACLLKKTDI